MILSRDVPEWETLCGCRYCDRDIDAEMCKKCREEAVKDEPQGVDWIWLTKGADDE